MPALQHREAVLVVAAALFFASLGILKLLRQEFVPAQDTSRFGIRFQTPVGTQLDVDRARAPARSRRFLAARPEVDYFGGVVGGFGGGEVNTGFVFVTMKDPRDRPARPEDAARLLAAGVHGRGAPATSAHPGRARRAAGPLAAGFSPGRGGGFPVEFTIRGRDWDELAARLAA